MEKQISLRLVNSFYISYGDPKLDEDCEIGPIVSVEKLEEEILNYGDMSYFAIWANIEAGRYHGK